MASCNNSYVENCASLINKLTVDCISLANKLIEACELCDLRISSLNEINTAFIKVLFQNITENKISDKLIDENSISEIKDIQCIIDYLSVEVLGLSLSHISAKNVVDGNPVDISNLLEVFVAVCLYISSGENDSSSSSHSHTSQLNISLRKSSLYSDNGHIPTKQCPIKRKTIKQKKSKAPVGSDSSSSRIENAANFNGLTRRARKSKDIRDSPHILKRKTCKLKSPRKLRTQGIEDLFDMNYHRSILALLSKNDLKGRTVKMKRRYLSNVKEVQKPIPECKKSFLLPYDLRKPRQISKRKRSVKSSPGLVNKENLDVQHKHISKPCVLQSVLKEFPGYSLPQTTMNKVTIEQDQHMKWMKGRLKDNLSKKCLIIKQEEAAARKQSAISEQLTRDILHQSNLNDLKKEREDMSYIQSFFRNARMQSAKMKQYFDEYHTGMKKKLQKENIAEELVVKRTFKKMLDIQKKEILDMCNQAKYLETKDAKLHMNYLCSVQNLYQDFYSSMAEAITEENDNTARAAEAHRESIYKDERDLITHLRSEIKSLQKYVTDLMEDVHFREADAEMFISDEIKKQKSDE